MRERQTCLAKGRGNAPDLDMGVEADKDRRQPHQRVHGRHKLWHLGHLNPLCQLHTDQGAAANQKEREEPKPGARPQKCGHDGQRHAHNPVPYRALGAFLVLQTAKGEDEKNSRNNISGSGKSEFHEFCPIL